VVLIPNTTKKKKKGRKKRKRSMLFTEEETLGLVIMEEQEDRDRRRVGESYFSLKAYRTEWLFCCCLFFVLFVFQDRVSPYSPD
jgi:hypothetical protein